MKISLLFPDHSLNFKKLSDETIHDLGMDSIIKKLTRAENEQTYIRNVMSMISDDTRNAAYRGDVFDDIDIVVLDEGFVKIKPRDHIYFTGLVENKSIPSGKTVSISLGTNGYWKAFNKSFDEFVSVEDSDDQAEKDMLEKTTKAMSGNRELAIRTLDHRKRVILAMNHKTTL